MTNIQKQLENIQVVNSVIRVPKHKHFRDEREGPLRVSKSLQGVNKLKTISIITLRWHYLFLLSYPHTYMV